MADDISIGKLFVELLVKDEKFGPALKGATAELTKLAAEAKRASEEAARGVQPLATAFNTVTEAEKRHITTIVASQAAETARAAALGITTGQLRQVDAALKAETTATTAATTATKAHSAALNTTTVSAGSAAGAATNLRFQLFDVVQQLSAGQNPLMILNQQGFQIVQAFGSGPSGAAGALATFTAALGPLGPIFTAVVAALAPMLVGVAALTAGYAVLENAQMDVEASSTGARDAVVDAAKKIKGTQADMDAGKAAWERFRDTISQIATDIAVARNDITKEEAETAARVAKVRKDAGEAIEQTGREYAAAITQIQALEQVDVAKGFHYEDVVAAAAALPGLRKEAARLHHELAMHHAEMEHGIDLAVEQGVVEKAAEDDKAGKKGKADATKEQADATKDQTAALRDYAAAMEKLGKVTTGSSNDARLTAFEDLAGSDKTERTFAKAVEKARQDAEKGVAAAEGSLADALAAATVIGGKAGKRMAEGANAAFLDAQRSLLGELVQGQDDAARAAVATEKAAAAKRVDANMGAISLQVQDEEAFAETLGKIREEYVQRYGELQRIEIDYARLTGDEKLAVEQKIQGEMADLRDRAAEAELERAKTIARKYGAEAKDVFTATKETVGQLYAYQTDQIATTTDLLAANISAREKMAQGELLSAEERAALLTYTEKQELEKRYEEQKKAALATFYAQQALAVVTIAINTAASVSQALANIPPPASYVAAAVMAGLGVVQAGLVLAQAPPEFHVGGVVDSSDRRRSPGRSTDRAVTTELEVGEGVLVSRTVQALGGPDGLARLNVNPAGAIASIASRMSPTAGVVRPPTSRFDFRSLPTTFGGLFGMGAQPPGGGPAAAPAKQPNITVVSKIGERTFDSIMADGLGGRRLPKVRARLQRMTGVTVGLDG